MSNQTVHFTTGLPAAGKTTYAMELLTQSKGSLRRVNLDDIRTMLDSANGVWTHKHEATAQAVQEAAVRSALSGGFDVIVDNTHLTPRMPGRLKSVFSEFEDLAFVVHDFTDVDVEECIIRDGGRAKQVGEEAIRKLYQRHRSATKSGWRLTADWLGDRFVPTPYVADTTLPAAILCDIDGTLAHAVGRGPYDFERCGEDQLDDRVAAVVNLYAEAGMRIILLSGRGEEFRPQTEEWLGENDVDWHELHMRPVKDTRRDDIVKAELFDQHIRGRFNVRLSLDDRDRVVRLWRRMGLPCWQVAPGNF
jgi:predicted kinase